MPYDLIDATTMNLVDWYDSLEEAIASVRETIQECGAEAVATWALVPKDTNEKSIGSEELVARALAGAAV